MYLRKERGNSRFRVVREEKKSKRKRDVSKFDEDTFSKIQKHSFDGKLRLKRGLETNPFREKSCDVKLV